MPARPWGQPRRRVDGAIKEEHLGLDTVYIQAALAEHGPAGLQSFGWQLESEKARKGVFITTSGFTKDAREYVKAHRERVVLIDGPQLATLMVDFGMG